MIKKTCAVSGRTFVITEDDLQFYQKMGVPTPTLCPEERHRRRLAIENERTLYRRKCDGTGKEMVSIYAPDHPYPVYHPAHWFSDHWDPRSYGKSFDTSKPFFEQFGELLNAVPKLGLIWLGGSATMENSDFNNDCHRLKNCYLIFDGEQSQDCLYGQTFIADHDSMDFLSLYNSAHCYECTNCTNAYELFFSVSCQNCQQSWFLQDCVGCKNCFGCSNLLQKEFYIYNKKHSQKEYEAFMSTFASGKSSHIERFRASAKQFWDAQSVKYFHGHHVENSTGDYLVGAKDSEYCFDCQNIKDCKYCTRLCMTLDTECYDCDFWGNNSQLIYESNNSGENAYHNAFVYFASINARDIWYSQFCLHGVEHLFGCIGIRSGKHCLLNKAYTQHEYDQLREKVVSHMKETGEWGEFFPIALSPFAYNETIAQEYFPLTKEEALARGYRWREEETKGQTNQSFVIPDDIAEVPDSICNEVLVCVKSGKPYKIQKAELKFYRTMRLPIPRLHPDVRHQARVALRNPRHLWSRKCSECQKDIETTYAPERPEKVLCEACYLKVVA